MYLDLNLASPEATAARLGRMIVAKQARQDRVWDLAYALRKLHDAINNEADVVQTLHVISGALTTKQYVHPSSGTAATVESLDSLADEIQYRDAAV
jgi:hypothetical protein